MANRKADYQALEREFITAEEKPSQRALAIREGISNGTLSEYARRNEWDRKRREYQEEVQARFLEKSAAERAERLSRLADRSIDVLEAGLARFAEELVQHLDENGESNGKDPFFINAKDGLEIIEKIRLMRGEPTQITQENGHGGVTINIPAEALRGLGEIARRSLQPGRVGGPNVLALPGGAQGDSERDEEGERAG